MTAAMTTIEELVRHRERLLWAVQFENGRIMPVESYDIALTLLRDPVWRAQQVLHRDVPGGQWRLLFDSRLMHHATEWRHVRAGDLVLIGDRWVALRADDIARVDEDGPTRDERGRIVAVRPNGARAITGTDLHSRVRLQRRITVPQTAGVSDDQR